MTKSQGFWRGLQRFRKGLLNSETEKPSIFEAEIGDGECSLVPCRLNTCEFAGEADRAPSGLDGDLHPEKRSLRTSARAGQDLSSSAPARLRRERRLTLSFDSRMDETVWARDTVDHPV
jgi:hypothetical protein